MQRLVHTRTGAGCRAGIILRDAAGLRYLLTCGHAFHQDQPFATSALGETVDAIGRRVLYARLRTGPAANTVDAALIECDDAVPARPLALAQPRRMLTLDGHRLTVASTGARLQLGPYAFTGMALAAGYHCHPGQSGSVVLNENGYPAGIVIGMSQNQIVLCRVASILEWFSTQGIPRLKVVALAASANH